MESNPIDLIEEEQLEAAIRAFARGVVRDNQDHRLKRERPISEEAKDADTSIVNPNPNLGWEQG
jgi:hypothetical protein